MTTLLLCLVTGLAVATLAVLWRDHTLRRLRKENRELHGHVQGWQGKTVVLRAVLDNREAEVKDARKTIVTMRREGFGPPHPDPGELEPADPELPEDIEAAVQGVARFGTERYRHTARAAKDLLDQGVNREAIIESVQRGTRASDLGIGG